MEKNSITVELVYKNLISFKINKNSTALDLIKLSNIVKTHPEINLEKFSFSIFSKKINLDYVLENHDRLEITGPILIDPKEARRNRAKVVKRAQKAGQ